MLIPAACEAGGEHSRALALLTVQSLNTKTLTFVCLGLGWIEKRLFPVSPREDTFP